MNFHQVVQRSLILSSIGYHCGTVTRCTRCRHINTWWSLMCQSLAVMCERGVNGSCEHTMCLLSITYWSCLQQIAPARASLAASFHDHHLRHLWDQTGRGDPISGLHGRRYIEVILHLRQLVGVIFILAEREKERDGEWKKARDGRRRRKEKNLETRECASLLFVRSCFINVEGHVLVLSVSREKWLSVFKHNFCLLVCCVASAGLARTQGRGRYVWEHRGTHGWYVGTFAKINLVTGGYSISSC